MLDPMIIVDPPLEISLYFLTWKLSDVSKVSTFSLLLASPDVWSQLPLSLLIL
jgi:hypothetical protein